MSLLQISEPGQSQIKEACKGRAVGIDLGTTNSLVAAVRDGRPVVLADDAGRALLPSVVHYGTDGVMVGAAAMARAAEAPTDTIASVKRFMGRGMRDAEVTRKVRISTPFARMAPASSVCIAAMSARSSSRTAWSSPF